MEFLDLLLGFVLGASAGGYGVHWRSRRPRAVKQEDRNAGLARYQDYKNGA